jgi:hypothetical protein
MRQAAIAISVTGSTGTLVSSVMTVKFANCAAPKLVEIATSAASRPRAITIRPIRGWLWRASVVVDHYDGSRSGADQVDCDLSGDVLGDRLCLLLVLAFEADRVLDLGTHPTSTVLSDAWYFAKRVTLSLALRSSGDAGRGFGRVGAAAALVAG